MSDTTTLSNTLAFVAATYLLHSTLLLSACWMLFKMSRVSSHFLVERMWKLAAVLGLMTASLQMWIGASSETEGNQPDGAAVRVALAEHNVAGAEYSALSAAVVEDSPSDAPDAALFPRSAELSQEQPRVSAEVIDQSRHHAPHDESGAASGLVDQASDPMMPSSTLGRFQHAEHDGYFDASAAEASSPIVEVVSAPELTWWNVLRTTWPWLTSLVAIALSACVIAGGVLLAFQSLRLRTRFATARLLKEGPARRTLDRFLKRNRVRRRVRLLASAKHTEPVTYGLFAWTIVLPESTEEQLSKDELKALLAHEVAHLVRGDVWWLWIGRVLCTCLAFQPLNWIARRKWQQAAEYLCDDWAVERGVRSLSLARCLTQIAEWRYGRQACSVGLAAGGTKATLVQRVERLVQENRQADVWTKPPRRRLLTMGAALAVVGLAGFAPRVALPLAAVSERAANEADEETTRDWRALEEELLELEADLERVNELLRNHRPPASGSVDDAHDYIQNLNRRAAALRARREHIASLFGKDSER
jgi:hypothetical protein